MARAPRGVEGRGSGRAPLPAGLRELCQWVGWRLVMRDGKPTKVPYRIDAPDIQASVSDPGGWGTFDVGMAVIDRFDGLGFVFSSEDPYCGIDFDGCVAEGEVDPAVVELLGQLDSYSEFSPSGTGVHAIVRAELGRGRRTGRTPWGGMFEAYDRLRYFTVTGNAVPGQPTAINDRQRELEAVLAQILPPEPPPATTAQLCAPLPLGDRELIDRAMSAANGAEFAALWRGEIGAYPSASEADLALCSHLAFWTGRDAAHVDRLFRQSGLMREKWERPDYREGTIGKALSGAGDYRGCQAPEPPCVGTVAPPTETPANTGDSGVPPAGTPVAPPGTSSAPRTLRVLDVERMLSTEPPPVPWLVPPVLARGCMTMLAGREGRGKSMLALGIAAGLGTGNDICGMSIATDDDQPQVVLYVDAENGEREAHRRVHGLAVAPGTLVYVEAEGFSLRTHLGELEALVDTHRPQLLVLDSLRSLAPGLDENDSMQAEAALRPVVRMTQARGIATLLLHHASRGTGEYRGSTALGAAVELGFTLSRHDDDPQAATRRKLACWKSRPAAEPPPRWLTITAVEGGGIQLSEAEPFEPTSPPRTNAANALLNALNGKPSTWASWARGAGFDSKQGTARRARDELLKSGRVTQDDSGMWQIVPPEDE